MIGEGKFRTDINLCEKLLTEFKFLLERNKYVNYSQYKKVDFKELLYADLWKKYVQEKIYDFLLFDQSVFQFRIVNDIVSYTYFECPYIFLNLDHSDLEEIDTDFFIDSVTKLKPATTPIRYDIDQESYAPGRHPVSHFHFGFESQIRICCDKIITPTAFLFFIIRQVYPQTWKKILERTITDKALKAVVDSARKNLESIDQKLYWGDEDDLELYLT
jgi:hypothetical protein